MEKIINKLEDSIGVYYEIFTPIETPNNIGGTVIIYKRDLVREEHVDEKIAALQTQLDELTENKDLIQKIVKSDLSVSDKEAIDSVDKKPV